MNTYATVILEKNNDKNIFKVELKIINDKINYQENLDILTDVLYDKNNNILIRDNNKLYMEIDFNKEKCNLYIKELKKDFSLPINVINIEQDKIDITYTIENDKYRYIINME